MTTGPDARLFDLGYRTYEGVRERPARAILTLAIFTLRRVLGLGRGARHKVLPAITLAIAFLPALRKPTLALKYVAACSGSAAFTIGALLALILLTDPGAGVTGPPPGSTTVEISMWHLLAALAVISAVGAGVGVRILEAWAALMRESSLSPPTSRASLAAYAVATTLSVLLALFFVMPSTSPQPLFYLAVPR